MKNDKNTVAVIPTERITGFGALELRIGYECAVNTENVVISRIEVI